MSKYHQKYSPLTIDLTRLWEKSIEAQIVHSGYVRVSFPVFSVSGITFDDASYIVAQYDVSLTNNFTIRRPFPQAANFNFCMIISWVESGEKIRRKLWGNNGEVVNAPLYNGEIINGDCRFECWNLQGQTSVALITELVLGISPVFTRSASCAAAMGDEDDLNTLEQLLNIPAASPVSQYAGTALPLNI